MMASSKSFPAERVIANLRARIEEYPEDWELHYRLGRAYYAAFASENDFIRGYSYSTGDDNDHKIYIDPRITSRRPKSIENVNAVEEFDLLTIPSLLLKALRRFIRWLRQMSTAPEATLVPSDDDVNQKADAPESAPVMEAEPNSRKAEYLCRAIHSTQRAIRLQPDKASVHLTLGCLYEEGLSYTRQVYLLDDKVFLAEEAPLRAREPDTTSILLLWRTKAAEEYLNAFDLTCEEELEGVLHIYRDSLSVEAAQNYLRMVDADPRVVQRKSDPIRVLAIKNAIKRVYEHAITPVIFSQQPHASLADAVCPTRIVQFDLDGSGRPQFYSWLQPDTGILVWDPEDEGRITSGRQLFGSVSWWIFWQDGYQALDALDDDRDGWLTADELTGIRVWFDRNGNGICEPGEVVSLEALGITAISCRATGHDADGQTLMSGGGIVMQNGQTFPTWDWIAQPLSKQIRERRKNGPNYARLRRTKRIARRQRTPQRMRI